MTITIRRSTTADAAAMARLMGDPELLPNLLQLPYTSAEIWQQRLADNNNAAGKVDLVLVAELDGEVVGNAGLHAAGTHVRRRHCAGLGIVVARPAQGRGVGAALMQALCDYADQWAQLLRIELSVFTDNERAIRLYERFGFVREGTHRGYALRAGAYVDVHSMARLHPNPPAIR
jgi:L-phenylalanine/L-methionine N-acetyltransferase